MGVTGHNATFGVEKSFSPKIALESQVSCNAVSYMPLPAVQSAIIKYLYLFMVPRSTAARCYAPGNVPALQAAVVAVFPSEQAVAAVVPAVQ
jgi:hypothetical protein